MWHSPGCRGAGAQGGIALLWLCLSPDVTTRDCGIQLSSVFLPVTVGVSPPCFPTDALPWKTNACNKPRSVCRGRLMLACSRSSPGLARRFPAARPRGPARSTSHRPGTAGRSPVSPRAPQCPSCTEDGKGQAGHLLALEQDPPVRPQLHVCPGTGGDSQGRPLAGQGCVCALQSCHPSQGSDGCGGFTPGGI